MDQFHQVFNECPVRLELFQGLLVAKLEPTRFQAKLKFEVRSENGNIKDINDAIDNIDKDNNDSNNCQNPTQLNSKATSVGVRHSSHVFHPPHPTHAQTFQPLL